MTYMRHGQGVSRVQHRKARRCAPNATLPLLFFVSDHTAGVHLRTGAGGRDHRAHRNARCGKFARLVLHVPDVLLQHRLGGDHLAAVDDAASANCQDEVHPVFTGQRRSLLRLGIGGVGHDAAELHDFLPGLPEQGKHLPVDTGTLDGAASVSQQHRPAKLPKLHSKGFFRRALAKIHLCGIGIGKIVHVVVPFLVP